MQVGSDPTNTAARYYYVYNAHGDVVNLVDASGNAVASYAYDTWGNLTSATESFANGWSNPYRYDGRDAVRYDAADGLYWMSVRAYDPTIGRFIAHDSLGRAPLFFADQPYAYAGNNPVSNVDPSGQRYAGASGSQTKKAAARQEHKTRVQTRPGGGSGGRGDNSVWRWDDGNKKKWDRFSAWMGPVERDARGYHFNLHVYKGVLELANYHVYYTGRTCQEDQNLYMWWYINTDGVRKGETGFWKGPEIAGVEQTAAEMAAMEASGYIMNNWGLPGSFFDRIMNLPAGPFDFEWAKDAVTERHLPDQLEELTKHPVTTNLSAW